MTTAQSVDSLILARLILPQDPSLPRAVAEELLKWEFSAADRQRMSELAAKARSGELTPAEREETDSFERVSSFLGLVKSKARRSLQVHAAGN